METSLHRDLKRHFAGPQGETEVRLCGYRIDAVVDGVLFEIQHGSLGAIRRKVERLVQHYEVIVVKPIVARKRLIKLNRRRGRVQETRLSPKRGRLIDLFQELVYFRACFPHPRLTLHGILVDVEEIRYPRPQKDRRWRRRNYVTVDQKLSALGAGITLSTSADLLGLLPSDLPEPFDTADLAAGMGIPRWLAQQVAYCCRHGGALTAVGKRGNAHLYRRALASA